MYIDDQPITLLSLEHAYEQIFTPDQYGRIVERMKTLRQSDPDMYRKMKSCLSYAYTCLSRAQHLSDERVMFDEDLKFEIALRDLLSILVTHSPRSMEQKN